MGGGGGGAEGRDGMGLKKILSSRIEDLQGANFGDHNINISLEKLFRNFLSGHKLQLILTTLLMFSPTFPKLDLVIMKLIFKITYRWNFFKINQNNH